MIAPRFKKELKQLGFQVTIVNLVLLSKGLIVQLIENKFKIPHFKIPVVFSEF